MGPRLISRESGFPGPVKGSRPAAMGDAGHLRTREKNKLFVAVYQGAGKQLVSMTDQVQGRLVRWVMSLCFFSIFPSLCYLYGVSY